MKQGENGGKYYRGGGTWWSMDECERRPRCPQALAAVPFDSAIRRIHRG